MHMNQASTVSLVTGASGAIGGAIARRLAALGHEVINLSLEPPAEDLPAITYCADLTDQAGTARVLETIVSRHRVRNLVNNAGFTYVPRLADLDLDRARSMFEIHDRASLQCMQALVPGMRALGAGRIVSIGSRMMLGRPGRAVYGMVKAGLLGMTRSLALELARDGITVNMVSPGPIETELFRANHPPGAPQTEAVLAGLPVGRIGTPDDVAHAVLFFLAAESGFVTGQNLFVCGGGSVGTAVF